MKKLWIISALVSLLLLSGCADYKEIDRGYIVTAIGVYQQTNETTVVIETVSSSNVADDPPERLLLYGEGDSFKTAINNLTAQLVKPLYFEHLGSVIFQENSTVGQQAQLLNYLINEQNINYDSHIVKTKYVSALFESDTHGGILGYDIIGLISNHNAQSKINIQNQIYHIFRQPNTTLPTIAVSDGALILEVSGEQND